MTSPDGSALTDEQAAKLLFSLLEADERNLVLGTPERTIIDGTFNLVSVAQQLLFRIRGQE